MHGYQYAAGCLLAGANVETIEALCACDDEFDAGMLHAINDWERLIQRLPVAAMMPAPELIQGLTRGAKLPSEKRYTAHVR